ncbi:MAG: 1-acyl-sn-glycerol-3-phosphate acyltransferase [Saprospiraceae bacterium]|nr:MAG: 1-acyl-sn-glycerol-3-phosphate acyltransferase [Saprospiraceae bacterium]
MGKLRAVYRAIGLALLTWWCLTPVLWHWLWGRYDVWHALEVRRRWAGKALRFIGVRVHATGKPPVKGPILYIGNHRSYIDPIVALTEIPAWPVAKAEVASWPVFGFAAKMTGILYVKREDRNSRAATLQAIDRLFEQGHSVLIYPEGTTHTEPLTRPFRPGTFKLAAARGIPVVPIAIHYPDLEDAWVGSQRFLPHFLRTFGKKHIDVYIAFGQAIYHDDHQELMKESKQWIDEWLSRWHGAMESQPKAVTSQAASQNS